MEEAYFADRTPLRQLLKRHPHWTTSGIRARNQKTDRHSLFLMLSRQSLQAAMEMATTQK